MALVEVSTRLPLPPDKVWALLLRPETLMQVSAPLLSFTPRAGPLPDQWQPGEYQLGVKLFGLVPLDDQIIGIEFPPQTGPGFTLRDNGRACARDGGPGGLIWFIEGEEVQAFGPEHARTLSGRFFDRRDAQSFAH